MEKYRKFHSLRSKARFFCHLELKKTSKFNCERRIVRSSPVLDRRRHIPEFARKTTRIQIFNSFKMRKNRRTQKNKRDWHYANHLDSLLKPKEAKCVEIDMPRIDTSMMKYISFTYCVKIQFKFHTTFITISCYNIQNGCSFSIFFCHGCSMCSFFFGFRLDKPSNVSISINSDNTHELCILYRCMRNK